VTFNEFKTLPLALSLEPSNTTTSNLPFENYTGYLLNHGLYSNFCSSVLRLSMDFVQPTCRLSYNNATRNGAYAHPLNFFSLSLLWTLWHTVNVPFLSPHLYYWTVYRILFKIQHLFRLLNLPSKHSYFGNPTSDLFDFMRNCILINYFIYFIYLLLLEIFYRI